MEDAKLWKISIEKYAELANNFLEELREQYRPKVMNTEQLTNKQNICILSEKEN